MTKTTVYNTFGFEPNLTMDTHSLKNAEHRGVVKIVDGEVVNGEEIIKQIKNNSDKLFLVNRFVFDQLDVKNICKWDEDKKEADNSAYYGLIFK